MSRFFCPKPLTRKTDTLISPTTHTSFLGFLEAGITPAFTIITSQWYRKHEQGTRTGIWFSCNALSLTLGAFIAYGFAEADLSGDLALPGWQVIFIFMGCLTTGMGVVLALFLPDTPLTARFLTAREKEVAIERIRSNQQSVENHDYKLYQVKEAFTDPMVSFSRPSHAVLSRKRSKTHYLPCRHGYIPCMLLRSTFLT